MHRGHIYSLISVYEHPSSSFDWQGMCRDPKFSNGRPILVIFDFVNVWFNLEFFPLDPGKSVVAMSYEFH